MQTNQLESQRNQEILALRQSIEDQHDSQVLIGEKTVEEIQFKPQQRLKEKLSNLQDNIYQSQKTNKTNKTRIIINDPRSKNSEIMINDKGIIDNSYDQTNYRGVATKLSPKKVVNRLSKSLARGAKQQSNLNSSNIQNSQNVSNLYLAQSQNNPPHPYHSVLRERPNRKIVKLGTTQSKFTARGNIQDRNSKPLIESSIDNTNKNKSSSQDLTLNDSFQSSTRKNQYVIHQSNNSNKIKYFPQNNIIVQNHRSPKGQSQQIATGSVNIQIQVIDNQQHHYKKKGEIRTQRSNIGTVLKSSNLISSLQKKVNDDLSYRQSKVKERAALHDRYENTIKQSRVQDTNMSLELSTERKSKLQTSLLNVQRLNYDSINYTSKIGSEIEEMHAINVRYNQQLKTLELKGKQSLYSSVFHEDPQINENDYNTVCAIETEIDLDY